MKKREERLEYDLLKTPEDRERDERQKAAEFLREEKKREEFKSQINDLKDSAFDFIGSDTGKNLMFYGAIVLIVFAAIFGIVKLVQHFQEQKVWTGTVAELHFHREKYIQQYGPTSGADWWDQQPQLSYNNRYNSDKVRSYHTESYWDFNGCSRIVDDSYTDSKGKYHSGSHTEKYSCWKTRQVPDYDRWYTYTINRWLTVQTLVSDQRQAKTELTLAATWPSTEGIMDRQFGTKDCSAKQLGTSDLKMILAPSGIQSEQASDPMIGCQQVSPNVNEAYYITYHYEVDGKPFSFECGIDYVTWQTLRVGKQAWGKYYAHNEGFDCNDGHIGEQPTPTKEGS